MKLGYACCLVLLFWLPASAQESHEVILKQLLSSKLEQVGPVRSVVSFHPQNWWPAFVPDTSAAVSLSVGQAVVTYSQAADKQIARDISLPVASLREEVRSLDTLRYRDLMSYQQMRSLLKSSPDHLRGKDPTFRGTWLMPFAGIVLGTGITVTLFYLRSR